MKKIILLAFVFLTTLTTEARSIMPSQYEVLTASLDKKHFDFSNQIVQFNKSENNVYLRIMNDICPARPGRPSCRATPMIMFDAKFTLSSKIKTDGCNSKIQKSDVVLVNGKKAQIIFTDYTKNICDIVYVSDYSVSLQIKDEAGVKSKSVLNVSNRVVAQPVVKPMPPQIIESFNLANHNSTGPFFQHRAITGGELSLDMMKDTVDLALFNNPCAGQLCLAIQGDLLRRQLQIVHTEDVGCNVKKLATEVKSLYDTTPAVVGAQITNIALEILDYRGTTCATAQHDLSVKVSITTESNFDGLVVEGEKSEAVLSMDQIQN